MVTKLYCHLLQPKKQAERAVSVEVDQPRKGKYMKRPIRQRATSAAANANAPPLFFGVFSMLEV
jgi:uncharacterized MAPEG superfamily protein